jgi:hypothetical protein
MAALQSAVHVAALLCVVCEWVLQLLGPNNKMWLMLALYR